MTALDDDAIVDKMHDAAIEIGELDGMTDRVLHAEDWMREVSELTNRLEAVINTLNDVLEAIR